MNNLMLSLTYKEAKKTRETLLLSKSLLNVQGKCIQTRTVLTNAKYILFYFCASWCNSACDILPHLKTIYEGSLKYNMGLQIIYVSLDTQEKEMMKSFKENHGDWYIIPFGDIAIRNLCYRYGITSIPYIVVVKRDGTIISRNAKEEIDKYGINVLVKWTT